MNTRCRAFAKTEAQPLSTFAFFVHAGIDSRLSQIFARRPFLRCHLSTAESRGVAGELACKRAWSDPDARESPRLLRCA
jgi:hypothetical protein